MPIKMPSNCIQLELNLSQRVAIIKANKRVVPFSTDMVPELSSRAAFENKEKGIAALKTAKKRIGAKSSFMFFRYSFLIKIGAIISEPMNRH